MADRSEVLVPEVATPAPLGSSQHHLSHAAGGRLIFSWVEEAGKLRRLRFAVREEDGWSTPRTVVTSHDNLAGAPVVLGMSDGTLAAAWIEQAELYVSRSADGGKTWSEPAQPYSDVAKAYEGQLSVAPLPGGRLALVWKDQRDKGSMQLRAVVVDAKRKSGSEIVLDQHICACCAADTVAQGNTLWTAYRDLLEGNVRDTALVRWSPAGPSRSGIVHGDHWVLDGCPVNGPATDSRAGWLIVSWFTAADGVGRVLTAFSPARERDFGKPIEVDGDANGYVEALLLEDGSALVAWIGRAGPVAELLVAQVREDGTVHGRTTVYRGAFSPWPTLGLAAVGDSVYVAWTDPAPKRVRLAKVPLASITAGPGAPAEAE
ncbi:MAG: exo-alpha-sialidase [Nitrococcus sp.]|nr:exo-alpha-sialidase [Nitrococcus sp.]